MTLSITTREAILKELKEELRAYKEAQIQELKQSSYYCEKFGISDSSFKSITRKYLAPEERGYRLNKIHIQSGKKAFENLTEEQKESCRKQIRLNLQNSYLSEEMVRVQLEEDGWKVMRLMKKEKVEVEGETRYMTLLDYDKLLNFLEHEKNGLELLKNLQELNAKKVRLQDFICKKGKKIKFVEVKNKINMKSPNEEAVQQQEAVEKVWGLGFQTELINLQISLKDLEKFAKENNTESIIVECDDNGEIILF